GRPTDVRAGTISVACTSNPGATYPLPPPSENVMSATERTLVEQLAQSGLAVLQQNPLLRHVLDSIAEGVIIADTKGRFLLFNRAAEEIIGIGLTDTTVENWSERYGCYLPDGETEYPWKDLPLARAALRGEQVTDAEVYIRHVDRPHGVWVSVNASP